MNVSLQIIIALGSILVLLGFMAIVRRLAQVVGLNAEIQRKLVHICTGLYALTFPWLFPERWPVYMLIAITLVVMMFLRLPQVAKTGLGSTLHSIERRSYGDVLLALSIGACFFLAQGDTIQYVLPIAVLTLADVAAALVGSVYGTFIFKVEASQKSIEGSVVFFTVTLLISLVCLMLLSPFAPPNILLLSLMIAGFGTLVEADSWRGFDNLFLPLGLLVFLGVHASSSLTELISLASIFISVMLGFRFIAPKLRLTPHAARVYVVAVFLLLAVTEFQNAVLPILVLFAHAWSRKTNPCNGRFPDLDAVAALALISFGWLTLGNATHWNAVSFYGINAVGLTMGLTSLALEPFHFMRKGLGLIVTGLVLCLIRQWVITVNPEASNWAEPLWAPTVITLIITATTTTILPNVFQRSRITKLTLLSTSVPLLGYLFSIELFSKMS